MEVEIGRGKKGRRAYGFDDIAIVPSRRTRDVDDVDITWKLGPHTLDLPCLASAMDGVVSPVFAVEMGRLGGLAVLNLEGLWSRYDDAEEQLDRIAALPKESATREMQEHLPGADQARAPGSAASSEIKDGGVLAAASLTPQRVEQYDEVALEAGLDVLVIQGTVVSRRARLDQGRAARPQEVHRRVPGAGDRRRRRLVRDDAAPDAHRRRRRARRRRAGPRLHHARRARHRRAAGDRDRRCRGGARAAPARDRPVLQRHRRRRHAHRRRCRQGDRPAAPTR